MTTILQRGAALTTLLGGFLLATLGGVRGADVELPDPGVEIQARGPIHEAFARPAEAATQPGPIVPKQPPKPVPEEPPEQRPEGATWIPGYWSWDQDRTDFLWVSGVWRVAPPERAWTPGYWREIQGGWQWVSGFWNMQQRESVEYLDQPPPTLDLGPTTPSPTDDSFWVPGTWVYRDSGFVWRPGYWGASQPGWVWNPSEYVWSPGGYVSNNGYWDYNLDSRGVCFAPVTFAQDLWMTPGWYYRPRYAWSLASNLAALFVRPSWGHYYCGDYFDRQYLDSGYTPWLAYGRRSYDPFYAYARTEHRGDVGWYRSLYGSYHGYHDGTLARPPRTFVQNNTTINSITNNSVTNITNNTVVNNNLVRPYTQLQRQNQRFTPMNQAQLVNARSSAEALRAQAAQRQQKEGVRSVGRPELANQQPAHLPNQGTPFTRPSLASPTHPIQPGVAQQPLAGAVQRPVTRPATVPQPSLIQTPSMAQHPATRPAAAAPQALAPQLPHIISGTQQEMRPPVVTRPAVTPQSQPLPHMQPSTQSFAPPAVQRPAAAPTPQSFTQLPHIISSTPAPVHTPTFAQPPSHQPVFSQPIQRPAMSIPTPPAHTFSAPAVAPPHMAAPSFSQPHFSAPAFSARPAPSVGGGNGGHTSNMPGRK